MTDIEIKTAIVEAAEKLRDAIAVAQKAGLHCSIRMPPIGNLMAFPTERADSIRDRNPTEYEVFREVKTIIL